MPPQYDTICIGMVRTCEMACSRSTMITLSFSILTDRRTRLREIPVFIKCESES